MGKTTPPTWAWLQRWGTRRPAVFPEITQKIVHRRSRYADGIFRVMIQSTTALRITIRQNFYIRHFQVMKFLLKSRISSSFYGSTGCSSSPWLDLTAMILPSDRTARAGRPVADDLEMPLTDLRHHSGRQATSRSSDVFDNLLAELIHEHFQFFRQRALILSKEMSLDIRL